MAEINRKARVLLIRELGVTATLRFLNQFDPGSGDYTAERHQWLGDFSLDDVIRDIEENAERPLSSRGQPREPWRGKEIDPSPAMKSISATT